MLCCATALGRSHIGGVAAGCVRLRRTRIYPGFPPRSIVHLFPPKAEMMNMSGENDGCLLFRRCSAYLSCSAELPAIPGDNFVILTKISQPVILAGRREKIAGSDFSRAKRARRARIRDDTRNVAAATVTRTKADELGNSIAEPNR